MTPRRYAQCYAAVMGAGLVAGCAVMNIDVDVYKGPLADHEDVQTEEFAALAIGAKPLLTQLRDLLQWPDPEDRACARAAEAVFRAEPLEFETRVGSIGEPEKATWYKAGAFAEPRLFPCDKENICRAPWTERAARVNDVLSLYDDKDAGDLEPFIKEGEAAIARYRRAIAVFDESAAEVAWARIQQDLMKPGDTAFDERFGKGSSVPPISNQFELLVLAYKRLIGAALTKEEKESLGQIEKPKSWDDDRFLGRSEAVLVQFQNFFAGLDNAARRKISTTETPKNLEKGEQGANFSYMRLSVPSVPKLHARALFEDPESEGGKLFVNAVIERGEAFHVSRQALRDLWVTSLDAYVLLWDKGEMRFTEDVLAAARNRYAELISFLVQERQLAAVLYSNAAVPEGVQEGFKPVLEGLAPMWRVLMEKERWRRTDYDAVEPSIARALLRFPLEVVAWLKQSDQWFIQTTASEFDSELEGSDFFDAQVTRQYGLVRGPTFEADELQAFIDSWQNVVEAASTVGFSRGRLADGLETSIENYMAAARQATLGGSKKERDQARLVLRDELVRFSKKVLFIADNDKLISDAETKNPVGDCRPNAAKVRAAQRDRSGIGLKKDELDRYVLMLQAVGNSIRIQADELRHQDDYAQRLKDRKDGELAALAEALGRTNDKTFDYFMTALREARQRQANIVLRLEPQVSALNALVTFINEARNGHAQEAAALASLDAKARADYLDATSHMQHLAAIKIMKGEDPSSTADVAAIKAALVVADEAKAPKDKITAEDARTAVTAWLQAEIAKYTEALLGQPRAQLLANARVFFEKEVGRRIGTVEESGPDAVFDGIRNVLESKRQEANDALTALVNKVNQLVQRQTEQKNTASGRRDDLLVSIDALLKGRSSFLREAKKDKLDGEPTVIKQRMVEKLEQAKAGKDAAGQNQLNVGKEELEAVTEPDLPGRDLLMVAAQAKDARDVLDDMIAFLRYELQLAVEAHGRDSNAAGRVASALKIAYDQRAGMAYIRPSGAYLRSSYPATGLQDDPELSWSNELTHHGLRSSPFFGYVYNRLATDNEKLEIVSEIDKQFWQTINSVRVAGTGITNYVIAKDDVGNWYVKSYSSNPQPIIDSAKSLALFGLGPQFGDANLLEELPAEDDGAGAQITGAKEVKKPTTPMQRMLRSKKKNYDDSTTSDFTELEKLVETPAQSVLVQNIKTAWASNPDIKKGDRLVQLNEALDTASGENLSSAKEKLGPPNATVPEKAARIVAALSEVKGLYRTLESKVVNLGLVTSAEAALARRQKSTADAEVKLAETEGMLATARIGLAEAKAEKEGATGDALKEADRKIKGREAEIENLEPKKSEQANAVKTAKAEERAAFDNAGSAQRAQAAALAEAARLIRKTVTEFAGRRLAAIDAYESAIIFIGDANNPEKTESEGEENGSQDNGLGQ